MTAEPVVCTEDPARAAAREEDFRVLLGKARRTERLTPQHLRMALATDEGLDISVLAHEMQCCAWFDFRLTPATDGTVLLDIQVPANAGPVRGPAPEQQGIGSPEDILDTFAQIATGTSRSAEPAGEESEHHQQSQAASQCGCC
ncbi:hypothetical protein EF847_17640 [Actinobacteria bacterium YIM 96077]|uniref:Uncharacterized protein n=1 Tax=Phytoactinopolyspora halophila TaxID=1981511 RepID=A0A329QT39_9ACTN|nr:hypothetical protein [Phytoactinopolyspora halophila]AYY14247.1 hypothetical protein EF847_17640 [Actinobacteria bacterium YIM 96077]RAW14789.1 hypothetical protein DPM12_09855 [Phytoactinopolyspora halophila]